MRGFGELLTGRRRCAVLGKPITHSLSPVLHRAAYAELGLDWEYDAHEVDEEGLPGFLAGLDDTWRGLSLTMPLKRAAVGLVDRLSERAAMAQAVNTVVLERGRRSGHNTDIPGAVAAVSERWHGPVRRAVILGGGATATSTLLALADLGCREVTLVVRDEARAATTLESARRHTDAPSLRVRGFDTAPVPADIVVSTIPAAAQTSQVVALAADVPVVFDALYDPWPTPLAGSAQARGATVVSGLDLLVHQAGEQVALMTGALEPPVAAMRRAGEEALLRRASGG